MKIWRKYAVLYATYAEVYILHILHLYALPTLLMTGNVTTTSMSPQQRLRSPCYANLHYRGALDWRNFRANGQKENAASFFCLCCLDRAVMVLAELHVTISKFSGLELEAQEHCLPWLKHLCQVRTRSLSKPEIYNFLCD